MNTISIRDFRSGMVSALDRSDAGEQIIISRGRKLYAIVPVSFDELAVSGTFHSATDGTFQSDMNGTFVPLLSSST